MARGRRFSCWIVNIDRRGNDDKKNEVGEAARDEPVKGPCRGEKRVQNASGVNPRGVPTTGKGNKGIRWKMKPLSLTDSTEEQGKQRPGGGNLERG